MIQVKLEKTKEGNLISCSASGHAFFAKRGEDVVCSAVTTLLRTTLLLLQEKEEVDVEVVAEKRGELAFYVKNAKYKTHGSFLQYAYSFLEKGLQSVEKEYPKHMSVEIFNEVENTEAYNGTEKRWKWF